MKYFVFDHQRDGTCYHEFYKGKWDGHTFWKADSLSLDDSYLFKDFIDAILSVVPNYDPFDITEISAAEWEEIGKIIITKDQESQAVYNEANEWLKSVFKTYGCFTILGI